MKAVLNACYGGFSLSAKAMLELIKMKSDIIEIDTVKKYCGSSNMKDNPHDQWNKIGGYGFTSTIPDVLYKDGKVFLLKNEYAPETRSHPDLVEVVEKLGKEANGTHAKLRIANIPDGIPWEISGYDGIESAEELHRSW